MRSGHETRRYLAPLQPISRQPFTMSTEARRDTLKPTMSTASIGVDNPYSVWTCSLTRDEWNLGLGVIVQLDGEGEDLLSLLPCLGAKLSQQNVRLQTHYALLTCHSNLHVVEDDNEQMYFNLKGLQAYVGPARDTAVHLEDCVSCAVSCCGPTSMLMLSSYAPAAYTLLPHSNGPCPIGYDFVILFLNKQFNFGETTPPPVVNVSQCLNLETCLVGEQARDGSAVRGFYLCSRQKSSMNMVSVEVPHPTEQMEVKRFCDEIDLYEKYQRLSYNCCLDLQSSKGAPIIYQHGEKRNLVGISSSGNQMVTSYGLCQLLAGRVYNNKSAKI